MIERRRAASPTGPSRWNPSESGPRCTSVAARSSSTPRSAAPSRRATPQIPHIGGTLRRPYRPVIDLHSQDLWQLVGLLVGVGVLLVLAPVLRIPYPILLVLGGLALAFVPGLPEFDLPPEVILLGFLPPLLYSSAFFTSVRDLRSNLRPVSLLAIGLVAATMAGVAVVAHWLVDDLTWPAAFVLGAVVGPTDPIAATSIGRRLGVPRRLINVIEG